MVPSLRIVAAMLGCAASSLIMGCSQAGVPGPNDNARNMSCSKYLLASQDVRNSIVKGNRPNIIPDDKQGRVGWGLVDEACQAQPDMTVADAMIAAEYQANTPSSSTPSATGASTTSPAGPANDGTPICKDFLLMSDSERDDLVARIAVDRSQTRVLNPAWRSNVEMVCGEHLGWTVGAVIDSVAGKPQPATKATVDPETGDEVPGDLPTCNPNDPWFKKLEDVGKGKCQLAS